MIKCQKKKTLVAGGLPDEYYISHRLFDEIKLTNLKRKCQKFVAVELAYLIDLIFNEK